MASAGASATDRSGESPRERSSANQQQENCSDPSINEPNVYISGSKSSASGSAEPVKLDRRKELPTTNLQSLMHLIKGNIGTGIMAMPSAIQNAGLWIGFLGILAMGFITSHAMHLVVKCSQHLCVKLNVSSLDFGEVAEAAFANGPRRLRKYSKKSRSVINVLLNITMFGFCCVYIVFIARSVEQVVEYYTSYRPIIQLYEAIIVVLIIPLTFIKHLQSLSILSSLANILTLACLIIIFQNILQDLPPSNTLPVYPSSWTNLALFYGASLFTFEGIGVVLPIENKMMHPQDYRGWTGVLTLGMALVTLLYSAVGFYGYIKYGHTKILGSITLNLPHTVLYSSVKVAYASSVFFTYLLQFHVPINLLWSFLETKLKRQYCIKYGHLVLKITMALVTFTLAAAIPFLNNFIALVGSLCCSSLALFFPAFLHLVTFWEEPGAFGVGNWHLYKDLVLMFLSLLGLVIGTYSSLEAVIDCFQHPNDPGCK